MRFRFQLNGIIDLEDESIGMKEVVSYLTKALEVGAAKITGITAFEMKQPKPHYSGKGIPRKRGT